MLSKMAASTALRSSRRRAWWMAMARASDLDVIVVTLLFSGAGAVGGAVEAGVVWVWALGFLRMPLRGFFAASGAMATCAWDWDGAGL